MSGFLVIDHTGEPASCGVVVQPDAEHPFVAPLYLVEGKKPNLRLGRHASSVVSDTVSAFEEPLQPGTTTEKAIAQNTACVGAVVVRFKKYTSIEYNMEIGSGFSIGPGLIVTARHMLIHPSGAPEWHIDTIHFVLSKSIIDYSVRPTDNGHPNYMCQLLSTPNIEGQAEDIQTQNGLKPWHTKYDVVFLGVSENVYNRVGCLVPFSPSLMVEQLPFVCAVGYPLRPTPNMVNYLFPLGITLPGEKLLISSSQLLDFRKRTIEGLCNFNCKMVSPGKLLDFDNWQSFTPQMLRLSLSVIGGVSGGPCIMTKIPNAFIGITSGAFNCDNFNVAVSVYHPLFVEEYLERVIPKFLELGSIPPGLKEYVDTHKAVLRPEMYNALMMLYLK